MRIQVLLATMNQEDHSILDKVNIQTDAIVGNQCDYNKIEEFTYKGHKIKWLSLCERGVGLNRNNALMRADADVVLFSDDDMVYIDGYESVVRNAFSELPDADIIIFDLKYPNNDRKPITKKKRVGLRGCTRFGAARFAVRLSKARLKGISFNLCFGGGAQYSSGEDSLFLRECLKHKLKVYTYPYIIASLQDERASTWFEGYNDKFFYDKGVVFSLMNPQICYFTSIFHCFKERKRYMDYGWFNAWKQMLKGIQSVG